MNTGEHSDPGRREKIAITLAISSEGVWAAYGWGRVGEKNDVLDHQDSTREMMAGHEIDRWYTVVLDVEIPRKSSPTEVVGEVADLPKPPGGEVGDA